jgi:hypothetical protein
VAGEQDAANLFADVGAARIAADHHVAPFADEPVAEQPELRALADAVDAVEGEKHWGATARGERLRASEDYNDCRPSSHPLPSD